MLRRKESETGSGLMSCWDGQVVWLKSDIGCHQAVSPHG